MIKLLLKLAMTGLVLNATWQTGVALAAHYQFRDEVRGAAMARDQNDQQLKRRILELAANRDIPLAADAFSIRHEPRHTFVEGWYERQIPLAPGFEYPWRFTWDVDAYLTEPPPPQP
jgi:hypothetical protein